MTDAQWALLEPLLPPAGNTGGKGGRPEKWDRRLVLDAIFYLVRGGISWRQLPADFPPHQSVYARFRAWSKAGAWCQVYAVLRERARTRDGRRPWPTAAVIDSQTVRAADTVANASSGYDAGKKTKGRKRHLAVDTGGLLLAVVVTTASLQDRDGAFRITARLREAFSTIELVWADGGYAGRFVTEARKIWNLVIAVVTRPAQSKGFVLPRRRWVVERTFGWLVKHRRLVRDYETLPEVHEAMIWTASIWQLSRRLTR
jgi:transposase